METLRKTASFVGRCHVCFLALLLAVLPACTNDSSEDGSPERVVDSDACEVLGLNSRIVTGTPCTTSRSPVVAITLLGQDGSVSLCSGTMITTNDILTAGHCFAITDVARAFIEVDGQRVFGSRARVHPQLRFDPVQLLAFNDVAIIELERAVNLPTVPLELSRASESGDIFSIFGYGLDENRNLGVLRSGEMRIASVSEDHIFAEYNGDGSTTCNGDSGGPAIISPESSEDVSRAALVGVVSSGSSEFCADGDIAAFANLQSPAISQFILSTVPDVATE